MNRENKMGFTLIELLAVIVILSVIIMITVPMVQDKINESKKNAFLATVKGYLRATQMKNTENGTTTFTINSGSISPSVDYKGKVEGQGKIKYDTLGKAEAHVWNGKYCAVKSYSDSEIKIVTGVTSYDVCMTK